MELETGGELQRKHQPEVYLNVWLSAPPRPNPGRDGAGSALPWHGEHTEGWSLPREGALSPLSPSLTPPQAPTFGPEQGSVAGVVAVGFAIVLQGETKSISPTSACPSPQLQGTGNPWAANLTSAWPPDVRVLLHFSHLKQGRCQSFPREVTFSAAMERRRVSWGTEQAPGSFDRLVALPPTLGRTFLGIFSSQGSVFTPKCAHTMPRTSRNTDPQQRCHTQGEHGGIHEDGLTSTPSSKDLRTSLLPTSACKGINFSPVSWSPTNH